MRSKCSVSEIVVASGWGGARDRGRRHRDEDRGERESRPH